MLVFSAASVRFAVSIADVSRILTEGEMLAIPFSHPALAGVVRDGNDIVPVFDLLGLTHPGNQPPRQVFGGNIVVIPTAKGPVGLRLQQLAGTSDSYRALPPARAEEKLEALPAGIRPAVGGVAEDSSTAEAFFLFSPEAFVALLGI